MSSAHSLPANPSRLDVSPLGGRRGSLIPFKRVQFRHRRVVAMFMDGYAPHDIAQTLGYSEAWVRSVLNNPSIDEYLRAALAEQDNRLRALAPVVVDSIRDSLTDDDPKVRLKAAEVWLRTQGKLSPDTSERSATAEDVARQILQMRTPDGTEITIAQEIRK